MNKSFTLRRTGALAFVAISVFLSTGANAQWLTSDTPPGAIYYDAGRVGIGTSAPASPLHISRSDGGGDVFMYTTTGAFGLYVTFQTAGQVRGYWGIADTLGTQDVIFTNELANALGIRSQGPLQLGNGTTAGFTMLNNNIGLGTTTPSVRLDVVGDANFTGTVTGGNIAAKYQDLAEWVPSREDLEPGTVVILDPSHTNHVMASIRPYDTRVAGVVSAAPGIILGEPGDSKEKIATTGRVRAKVDATHGPISVGDLLVTSERAGFAMKSNPVKVVDVEMHRPGTIIGKALEPLPSGSGQILVLLSLQ